jgi:DNA-binding NarL/FixJ family response regulator
VGVHAALATNALAADERLAELAELRERVEHLERRLANRAQPLGRGVLRSLTAREREVAELVANGNSNHEVARTLHMSSKTVEWNLSKIYRKVHVSSRTGLAAKLIRARAN